MENKVIAITGAASGVGRTLAKHLAPQGAILSLADIQGNDLDKVVAEIVEVGGKAFGKAVDIRQRPQVEAWISETVGKYGQLDGVANIAGVTGKQVNTTPLQDTDDDDWDFVIATNQRGTMNCLRAQIPHVKPGGSIVNMASVGGIMGFPNSAAYVASKHAIVGMTKTAARELAPTKIRCNVVCPGPILTPMLTGSKDVPGESVGFPFIGMGRPAKAEEVAEQVEWLLSDKSAYITGTTQVIDGGWVY